MATKMTVKMEAINDNIYPKKTYSFEFDGGAKSDGILTFPQGLTVIKKGETETVKLETYTSVNAKVNEGFDNPPVGAGQVILIDE